MPDPTTEQIAQIRAVMAAHPDECETHMLTVLVRRATGTWDTNEYTGDSIDFVKHLDNWKCVHLEAGCERWAATVTSENPAGDWNA